MHSDNCTAKLPSKRTRVVEKPKSEDTDMLVGLVGLGTLIKDTSLSPDAVTGRVGAPPGLLVPRHQGKKQISLFPLLFEPDNTLFKELRSEDGEYMRLSDALRSAARSGDPDILGKFVVDFSSKMESHFFIKEAIVLEESTRALSWGQLDIRYIKPGTGRESAQ